MTDAAATWTPIGTIKPWDKNPRRNEAAVDEVAKSIKRFGFGAPILARTQDRVVIAGHTRLKAAQKLGLDMVPVRFLDLDPAMARALALADNKLGELAQWDDEGLADVLRELEEAQVDFDGLGFSDEELEDLLGPHPSDSQASVPLSETFGVPPMSVLDTRQGYWMERKRHWRAIVQDAGETRKATLFRSAPADPVSALLQESGGVSILDPVLAELVCRWFSKEGHTVLDPFAGDTVFGMVAAYCGLDFTGIELRQEQADLNNQRLASAGLGGRYICDTSANLDEHVQDSTVDLLFSCPPYVDLEVYSDDPRDLSTMAPDAFFEELSSILRLGVRKLRPDRFAVIVMSEVRDKRTGSYLRVIPRVIEAMTEAGMALWNELILVNPIGTAALRAGRQMQATRKVGRVHQNVLVFYNGDQRAISEELGAIDLVEDGTP